MGNLTLHMLGRKRIDLIPRYTQIGKLVIVHGLEFIYLAILFARGSKDLKDRIQHRLISYYSQRSVNSGHQRRAEQPEKPRFQEDVTGRDPPGSPTWRLNTHASVVRIPGFCVLRRDSP